MVDVNDDAQAQTISNYYLVWERNHLIIILVTNKVDLKNANPEKVKDQLQILLNIEYINVIKISVKLNPILKKEQLVQA